MHFSKFSFWALLKAFGGPLGKVALKTPKKCPIWAPSRCVSITPLRGLKDPCLRLKYPAIPCGRHSNCHLWANTFFGKNCIFQKFHFEPYWRPLVASPLGKVALKTQKKCPIWSPSRCVSITPLRELKDWYLWLKHPAILCGRHSNCHLWANTVFGKKCIFQNFHFEPSWRPLVDPLRNLFWKLQKGAQSEHQAGVSPSHHCGDWKTYT